MTVLQSLEASIQIEQDGWIEDELRDETIEQFETFSFDPEALMAAYGGR